MHHGSFSRTSPKFFPYDSCGTYKTVFQNVTAPKSFKDMFGRRNKFFTATCATFKAIEIAPLPLCLTRRFLGFRLLRTAMVLRFGLDWIRFDTLRRPRFDGGVDIFRSISSSFADDTFCFNILRPQTTSLSR